MNIVVNAQFYSSENITPMPYRQPTRGPIMPTVQPWTPGCTGHLRGQRTAGEAGASPEGKHEFTSGKHPRFAGIRGRNQMHRGVASCGGSKDCGTGYAHQTTRPSRIRKTKTTNLRHDYTCHHCIHEDFVCSTEPPKSRGAWRGTYKSGQSPMHTINNLTYLTSTHLENRI